MRRRRRYRRSIGGNPPIALEKKTIKTILGVCIIGFAILLLISFFNQSGILLSIRDPLYEIFGAGIIFIPALLVLASFPLLSLNIRFAKINVIFGSFGVLLSLIGLIALFSLEFGGKFGSTLWLSLASLVTPVGSFFILFFALVVSIIVTLNTSLKDVISSVAKTYQFIAKIMQAVKGKLKNKPKPKFATRPSSEAEFGLPIAKKILPSPKPQKRDLELSAAFALRSSPRYNGKPG